MILLYAGVKSPTFSQFFPKVPCNQSITPRYENLRSQKTSDTGSQKLLGSLALSVPLRTAPDLSYNPCTGALSHIRHTIYTRSSKYACGLRTRQARYCRSCTGHFARSSFRHSKLRIARSRTYAAELVCRLKVHKFCNTG